MTNSPADENAIPIDPMGIFALPVPLVPATVPDRFEATAAAVAAVESEASDIRGELRSEIEDLLIPIESAVDLTIAELQGSTDREITGYENELGKVYSTVLKSATADMQGVYDSIQGMGATYPQLDSQVVAELSDSDPYTWVTERLQGSERMPVLPPPSNSPPPPIYVPIDPPVVIQDTPDWPPPSIFDPPQTPIPTTDQRVLTNWPSGQFCNIPGINPPGVGGGEIGEDQWLQPIPLGCYRWYCTDALTGQPRVFQGCQTGTGVPPSQPPTPPILPPTVPPVTGACAPVCVGQSVSATITFGPACGPSSPSPTGTGTGTSPPTTPPTVPPPGPPSPPAPDPAGGDYANLPRSEWDYPAVCQVMNDAIRGTGQTPISTGGDILQWIVDPTQHSTGALFPDWLRLTGLASANTAIIDGAKTLIGMATQGIQDTLGSMEKDGWPINHVTWSAVGVLTGSGFLSQWIGAPLDYVTTPIKYMMQYSFPVYIPTQSEVDGMFMTGYIDDGYWECLTRANGNLPNLHRKNRDAGQTRTNIADLVELYYRKTITKEQLYVECRKRGVTDYAEVDRWIALHYQYPTMADIILMMVREVDIEASVTEDRLDEGFDKSYSPQLKEWAEIGGIPEQVMRYNWRAHWQEVSPSQIYTMLQRLRPGRDPHGIEFTMERAVRFMKEADYPPGIIDQLIAISYNPITRTDAIKGFYAGTIDEKELVERFLDVGYDIDNAKLLKDILHDDRERRTVNQGGQWTPRRILKEYRDNIIDRSQAEGLLLTYYKSAELRNQQLDAADEIRSAEIRRKCMMGVRRRFLIGEYDDPKAKQMLQTFDYADENIDMLLNRWNCEKYTRRKEPTVKFLQEWLYDGFIDMNELLRRLVNLGYEGDDAIRIANHTFLTLEERKKKQEEDAKKKQDAEEKKKQRVNNGRKPKTSP